LSMVTIKKCQSKKHSFGGCGDPRCPEGLSIQNAMEHALKDQDVMAYIEARQLKDLKPNMLFIDNGMAALFVNHSGEEQTDTLRFKANRPEVLEYINSIDRTTVPSFETLKDLEKHINDTYRPYASFSLRQYDGYGPNKDITRVSVADMRVDADLRGAGLGSYFRKTLLKHADEKGYVVSGTPTNSGDGTLEHTDENHEEYVQHAINHRARLEHFYVRNGYEKNYGTLPVVHGQEDYLTKKKLETNQPWLDRFNHYGHELLFDAGSFIRWPNNQIPASLLAK
jgi:GNAT superfamily N-acetyltransferase